MKTKIFLLVVAILSSSAYAQIEMSSIFGNNMVFQQKSSVPIWGNGIPNSEILVSASWGENVKCIVGEDSLWQVDIKTPNAGGPFNIVISDKNTKIDLTNVLSGEVWLCSGQSNMEMPLAGWPPNDIILTSEEEIKNSTNSQIRFFTVEKDISVEPKTQCIGNWVESTPKTSAPFSATAYFFGKKLYNELNIPIGLIHTSWGGTPAEAWTSKEFLSQLSDFDSTLLRLELSKSRYKELDNWLSKLPRLDVSSIDEADRWSNLNFNDAECSSVDYNHSEWKEMDLPILWEKTSLGEFDGAVWFRKVIGLKKDWLNTELRIELGPIDDFDATFINGQKVGAIEKDGNYQTKRIYTIPSEINNQSKLVIAVRVNDTRGGGGIYGKPEEMKIVNPVNNSVLSIAGKWNYLPVAEFSGMAYYIFDPKTRAFNNRPNIPIALTSNTPTVLYNAMIAPLVPFKIKGAIWYQGESNAGNPQQYEILFPTMIKNWRDSFKNNFPFYFTQIAPYNYGENTKSEFLRDAQRKTLSLENTGMAVTLDIGDTTNIHPANKKDVGERLAFWALAKDYEKNIEFSGPIYKSMQVVNNKIELEFDNIGSGIIIKNRNNQFIISGEDQKFVNAKAKIENNKVIVWCDKLKNPVAVRYAWHNNSQATLFNKEGLPASSFRTDDWDK
ncbi:MAG: sialate O-acetylesterase [Melioribacteraceae bacterium]